MITVFGSLNIDMVLPVERMPRIGDTVLCPGYKIHPGGKGANQAVAAARMGAEVTMFGCAGQDSFGKICQDSLKTAGVITDYIRTSEVPTGCATICVDTKGENMITVASGANLKAQSHHIKDEMLTEKTTLIMQMEVPGSENWSLIQRAAAKNSFIILNLAPAQEVPDNILKSISVLVMNQIEATTLALNLGFDVISPTIAARRISAQYGITAIVTLGADGAFATSPQGTWTVQALPVKPIDTTAAGDAFVGVLAAALDQKISLDQGLRRASVASGLACLTQGAQPSMPSLEQVEKALSQVPLPRRAV